MIRCTEIDRWLDQGRPAERTAEAEAHARTCERCARAIAAERELESMLAAPASSAAAPVGFTDRVMARVAASRATRRAFGPAAEADVPWWVFAAAEPATVLAALLAALVLWQPKPMLAAAMSLAQVIAGALGQSGGAGPAGEANAATRLLGPTLAAVLADPVARMGLWLAVVPLALWISYELFRWTERRTVVAIAKRR